MPEKLMFLAWEILFPEKTRILFCGRDCEFPCDNWSKLNRIFSPPAEFFPKTGLTATLSPIDILFPRDRGDETQAQNNFCDSHIVNIAHP